MAHRTITQSLNVVITTVACTLLLGACDGTTPAPSGSGGAISASGGVISAAGGNTGIISPQGGGAGVVALGGATAKTTNVVPANGGTPAAGGNPATGGNPPAAGGNPPATGGNSPTTGGTTAKATTPASGGSNTSGCTDTPRSSETCADAKSWGFCSQTWFNDGGYCKQTCGTCTGASTGGAPSTGGSPGTGSTTAKGGSPSTGGSPNTGGSPSTGGTTTKATTVVSTGGTPGGVTVPRLSNGTDGVTTRYWDCCKPSCGWTANVSGGKKPTNSCGIDGTSGVGVDTQSACSGGSAYQCFWGAPWSVSDTLSYGFAAFNGNNCGKCYQLDFTGAGDNTRASALSTKSMIVQAINFGDIGANHFDILIPGGGVGANNACTGKESKYQWGNVPGGSTYGGFLTTCNDSMSCVTDMCTAAFGSKPALVAACQWYTTWFNGANNPKVKYAEVPCPAAITAKSGM